MIKPKSILRALLLSSLCCFLPSCSVSPFAAKAVRISDVRPTPQGIQVVEKQISKIDVERALEASRGAGNLRVVPLVTSAAQAPSTPEYRLFNIRRGTIGDLLGLENADILIAAHEYVVRDPGQFYAYLEALKLQKTTQIEIRRSGRPLLFKYEFGG